MTKRNSRSARARPMLALLIAVVVGLTLAACGDDEEESTTATDTAAAEQEVEDAATAYGDAEGSDTCDFIGTEAIESIGGVEDCEKQFENATPTEYEIENVSVSGNTATVTGTRTDTDEKVELNLVLEDTEWKVDPTK